MFSERLTAGNVKRRIYAESMGLDLLYAENVGNCYSCWAYSDGASVPVRDFYTLEGLQTYAAKHHFAVIYVN